MSMDTDDQIRNLVWELDNAFNQLQMDDLKSLKLNGDLKGICEVLKKYGMCEVYNEKRRISNIK